MIFVAVFLSGVAVAAVVMITITSCEEDVPLRYDREVYDGLVELIAWQGANIRALQDHAIRHKPRA